MEKITMKEFEERIKKDEALTAKAKEAIGNGAELNEKIQTFAASLGYEIDFESQMAPEDLLKHIEEEGYDLTDEEMDRVAGGSDDWKAGVCPKCGCPFSQYNEETKTYFCTRCENTW